MLAAAAVGAHWAGGKGERSSSMPLSSLAQSVSRSRRAIAFVAAAAMFIVAFMPGAEAAVANRVAGNAWSVFVDLEVLGVPVHVDELNKVVLPSNGLGGTQQKELLTLALGQLTAQSLFNRTEGTLDPAFVHSESSLERVRMPGVLSADLVQTECTGTEDGTQLSTSFVNLVVFGNPVPGSPSEGETIGPQGGITVILNDQVNNDNLPRNTAGHVNAIHVIFDTAIITGKIVVSHSHCILKGIHDTEAA
jgi:hypothetical protein